MRVAIMRAGLSGLSCAIILEKYGVQPTIFEDNYDIHLKPVSHIKEMIIHSRNEVGTIKGNLGISNIRGRHEDSFENQLSRQVKSKIVFNSKYTYEDLKKEFTHIVLATGDGAYACRLNNYKCDVPANLKGATVEGNFKSDKASTWFNHDFVPKGYAYLIPFSQKEAHIVIAYPNYPENSNKDINDMWQKFYEQVCKDTNQNLRITDRFQVKDYIMGICNQPKIDNTYFVGNCFGTISPGLGFGQFTSILTGIYAAYDICGIEEYETLTKPLKSNYKNSLVLRKTLEELNDNNFDMIIKNLDNKLFDKLIDKLHGDETNFDLLKWVSYVLRPWISLKQ